MFYGVWRHKVDDSYSAKSWGWPLWFLLPKKMISLPSLSLPFIKIRMILKMSSSRFVEFVSWVSIWFWFICAYDWYLSWGFQFLHVHNSCVWKAFKHMPCSWEKIFGVHNPLWVEFELVLNMLSLISPMFLPCLTC